MKIRTKIFALVAALSVVAVMTAAVGISTLQTYNGLFTESASTGS
jgi:methyl-accepting chemotaxis protein